MMRTIRRDAMVTWDFIATLMQHQCTSTQAHAALKRFRQPRERVSYLEMKFFYFEKFSSPPINERAGSRREIARDKSRWTLGFWRDLCRYQHPAPGCFVVLLKCDRFATSRDRKCLNMNQKTFPPGQIRKSEWEREEKSLDTFSLSSGGWTLLSNVGVVCDMSRPTSIHTQSFSARSFFIFFPFGDFPVSK